MNASLWVWGTVFSVYDSGFRGHRASGYEGPRDSLADAALDEDEDEEQDGGGGTHGDGPERQRLVQPEGGDEPAAQLSVRGLDTCAGSDTVTV